MTGTPWTTAQLDRIDTADESGIPSHAATALRAIR